VIDYTQADFTRNGERYDAIIDAVGKHSFRRCRGSLIRGGAFVSTDLGFMAQVPILALVTSLTSRFGITRVYLPVPNYTQKDMIFLKELVEAGAYRPVIDRRYALEQVVEAATYVDTEPKTGNVVLTVL
jgi:NADPH:quinone reductase-like Zn-dependent oxidoreductase